MVERNRTIVQLAIERLIRIYQLAFSPLLPPSCRFYPTCSQYALEAVRMHGACRGSVLAIKRLCKCNPWNDGGFDPVCSDQQKKRQI